METTLTHDGEVWASEQLVLCRDEERGLRAVIAIDDTTLGPGLGGIRYRPYPNAAAAIFECRRLAAAMTLKNALAEVPFGGAKSVILDDGPVADRAALMHRFGDFVLRTGGAYLPGVDMGTRVGDLATIRAAGADVSCADDDPSPWTALGVAAAIVAAVEQVDRRSGVEGVSVLVQGAGHVGDSLARHLAARGAHVLVADVDGARAAALAEAVGGAVVAPEEALSTPCDVLAPCAVARVVNAHTVPRFACRIVAGAANDTLAERDDAERLAARGIVYVPDYVANAGGVVHIDAVRTPGGTARLGEQVLAIGDRVHELLVEAADEGVTATTVAERRAARILQAARASKREAVAA
ncbi:Glu/Leu/Phe/Val dehydrogenase dimerization domain-containing protein [Conexibacter sp. JD483]|uniref:Glu/Leu/Phe/Val dehydrogenase dimerization domain-containing protein n=1 Tax=unclassified Conexibacter TaxID=2627773 RepID=UPI002717A4B2|nr:MULTISPECIES: Glu/Leu/Phe/Val dehydrogenase dimerization domain-containing protein [unclassified Conexibacter]MDO8187557.1 Glu/Leu/Phe/Val dehydrogenase dimerization domain-containing protein [Conexibacter sp. CPCC 205706]MDO8198923.1 Glu/Leu/Phe/Val dehydrogenase dimerization domain-containing protein [Conexibacter sp. CPCC 205762]MDR9372433.1 Glu/Leu/Phe/Val dehydrogenase dimerization domain-containing protein [Conexibacter sp. JD483]